MNSKIQILKEKKSQWNKHFLVLYIYFYRLGCILFQKLRNMKTLFYLYDLNFFYKLHCVRVRKNEI